MHRYFVRIKYNGSSFSGWQFQKNAYTVQQAIEENVHKLFREEITIVGCGRTDTGVHASDYTFHFEAQDLKDISLTLFKLNRMLPDSISVQDIRPVQAEAHARFDAISRGYVYRIHRDKNPFLQDTSYYFPILFKKNLDTLNEASKLFLQYKDFFPFCKTNSDVRTTICNVTRSEWEISETNLSFHIEANRFLRGMVRLIVGSCINVAMGKLSIEEIAQALEAQSRLKRDLSVPAHGLFLNKVEYPERLFI